MARYAMGVDIGGTNVKLVVIDEKGAIHLKDSVPTPQDPDPKILVDNIIQPACAFKQRAEEEGFAVEGVGVTVPHFYEGEDWAQQQTNNMPSIEGFPMRPQLAEAFGDSIRMINDLSAAGIAEYMFGAGQGYDRMLLMAIGTGIAISVVTEEHGLVHYSWDTTGDTGQIIVDPYGLADCTCGGRGCLEAVASARAIRNRALREVERGKATTLAEIFERQGDLEARDVSEAAVAGDAIAKDIMDQVGFFLGIALTSYLHIFHPSLMVLGGGVGMAGDLLIKPIRQVMNRLGSPWYLADLQDIVVSSLGTDAGAIGCASLILYPDKCTYRG
jgi:glucokinase